MDDGRPLPGVLSREEIRRRIESDRPLIAAWVDLGEQLQPNGFDLSLREVQSIDGRGVLAEAREGRKLPALGRLEFDTDGFIDLGPGPYSIVFNEIVDLPTSIMALGRPRSSLCRSGVTIHTAVWDAGYRGRSTALLNVLNPNGFRVQRNARLAQLVFMTLTDAAVEGYSGRYQGENIERG
ncbi:MAG TPA: deoxyuridine 5'-triphosphate nucleotidohydrolase [Thermomicrobiales bacterium]|nr:deoxyuridine 5'-triphosphate nucleotidohydrolase [Thermomicrobiales bacterium]